MSKPIKIIQGDTFDLDLDIRDCLCQDVVVNRVEFVCKSLGLHKEFIEADCEECEHNLWYLSLTADETSVLRVGNFTFDVTAYLEDGDETNTIFHNEVLEVIFKPNKWQN